MYPTNATGGGTSYTTASEARLVPPPNGQVFAALDMTGKLLETGMQELSSLEQRLAPILRGPMPTGAEATRDKPRAEPSQMTNAIESVNARLSHVIDYVRGLNARVDL